MINIMMEIISGALIAICISYIIIELLERR